MTEEEADTETGHRLKECRVNRRKKTVVRQWTCLTVAYVIINDNYII